ncbi:serine/threonine-protein kinase haspin [Rhineura floridana]|uniref:serine/threonine-protein kinase haspin n=1 Tax=Rhineura floridana TaxID=261503 RepID=UPI002AC83893|nr:serine/threonine-protein kinase haspin [Rhineura floridana]
MEQLRPRLLRTYSGLRGRRGRGRADAAVALRRLPPKPAPWISPQVDPRRFFSSSASSTSATASSPSLCFEDPDFLPPKGLRRAQQRKKPPPRRKGAAKKKKEVGAKENQALQKKAEAQGGASAFVPPTPLRRNITQRRPLVEAPWGRQRGQFPLLSSTPELPLLTSRLARKDLEEEESALQGSPDSYCYCCCCISPQERLKVDSWRSSDALSELSSLKVNRDTGKMEGSFELLAQEESSALQQKPLRGDSQTGPPPLSLLRLSSLPCTPLESHAALQSRSFCSQAKAPSGDKEGLITSLGCSATSPGCLHSPDTDCGQKPTELPNTDVKLLHSSRGAFQLRAQMCDGKIALSLPKNAAPLVHKRQRVSVQVCSSPLQTFGELNGALLEEEDKGQKDPSSPHLQPVVLLDNQVVPNWLASHSTGKQVADHLSWKKEAILHSDSPTGLPRVSDTRSGSSQVVPTARAVGTGRKACISGFSSRRWEQRGKLKKLTHKKNVRWKHQADSSFLQERLKCNEMEDDLSLSFLSPESSFKNSSLWRRIRASFSLHKKKIIVSEAENCSSIASTSFSSVREPPKTPFTKKLGYSICPASSMVLLSPMTSFSMLEVTLTDEEKVYGECQQEGPISFEECIPPDKMQKCEKIGEGVFGEVFRTEGERGVTALKIIPIEGSDRVNGEPQKTFREILPEIIISKELSLLADEEFHQTSGFISLYSVHCVQGAYPDQLLTAWDEYHRVRESENDRPDFFGDQQLFMVLEFEFGGMDLESMRNRQLTSVAASKSILHQVTASLAVAEEALHFEHRDLHWGNVLVKKTNLKEVSFTLNGVTHTLPTQGILVNIIDYTFSRLEKDCLTVYCDLSTDEEIFQGRGDYQFDIYRQMREENANSWADYFPHSNILWLHYLADKLLKEVSYRKKPTAPALRQAQKQLKRFCDEVLGFGSATDLLNTSSFFQ